MKYLALAVLLTVMQATPPVPRKAANNHTGQATKHHHQANTQQKDAALPIAPVSQPRGTTQSNSKTNPESPSNAEEAILVRELPAVTISTDVWTKASIMLTGAYVVCTVVLVVVAVFGSRLANRTLTAIEHQGNLMEGGLHVDGVRMIEFGEGRSPICFVKIANSGPIPKTVSIAMNLRLRNQITHYSRDQSITIPAHGAHEAFILSERSLLKGELLEVEYGSIPLRVYGHIRTQKKTEAIEYCYKYLQWKGTRPLGLPDFVTCDFDTKMAVSGIAEIVGVAATVSAGQATAGAGTVENPPPETTEEPSDPN